MKLQQRYRERLRVNGTVQGVGFRPFVYRLALELGIDGFVANRPDGVIIEIEGDNDAIEAFILRLEHDCPPAARIHSVQRSPVEPAAQIGFSILDSEHNETVDTAIPPDLALCDDCLAEMRNPTDRRRGYPFVNCTNCGPRYTIVNRLPYDRPSTSMLPFEMCDACAAEYGDPTDRRFHAQPVACPQCGPWVWIHDGIVGADAVGQTISALKSDKIVAIRGLGGFHLAVDATNEEAVVRLRQRKNRQEKPLALMSPSIETIQQFCQVSAVEAGLLAGADAPIVLLRRLKDNDVIAPSVAYDNRFYGFMLPYTPLHHLILDGNFDALVMTSGNLSEEPIAIDNDEAIARLDGIADVFLLHNRDILQRCDDSIVRYTAGRSRVVRRARGFVPQPILISEPCDEPILAVGGELKNTIALARGNQVVLSQHVGDLDNPLAMQFFEHCIQHLESVLQLAPRVISCDLHPEYLSTKWANAQSQSRVIYVQHHHAHMASVMAEHHIDTPIVGIILDGAGFGTDGTIWGGEILVGDTCDFNRYAWLEPVALPGGAAAMREPWRMALSYLAYAYGGIRHKKIPPALNSITEHSRDMVFRMIDGHLNSPLTSSCGRLFDGVAAFLGLGLSNSYEAQAAMALEMSALDAIDSDTSGSSEQHLPAAGKGPIPFGWIIRDVIERVISGRDNSEIAAEFHRAVGDTFVGAALCACRDHSLDTIGLSGGVFQNTLLLDYVVTKLRESKVRVLAHESVPTNDGGLALGQAVIANATLRSKRKAG